MAVIRLPKANTWFQHYKDTQLATIAQNIHDGLLAAIADFPTPPVLPLAIQGYITAYITALSNAVDGSKESTRLKNAAKVTLQTALRLDCKYVNQIVYLNVFSGLTYEAAQAQILTTGYQLSKDPTPVGEITQPVIKKFSSPNPRMLAIQVIPIPGVKGYSVEYWEVGTDRDLAKTWIAGSSRIRIPDAAASGTILTFGVFGIGASNISVESNLATQVII